MLGGCSVDNERQGPPIPNGEEPEPNGEEPEPNPEEESISGQWLMLRHSFTTPGSDAPPADVTETSFTQEGSAFTQFFGPEDSEGVSGTVEGSRYTQTDGSFTAQIDLTDKDHATGTFTSAEIRFSFALARIADPSYDVGGSWSTVRGENSGAPGAVGSVCTSSDDCNNGLQCFQPNPEEGRFCVQTCDPGTAACRSGVACLPTGDPSVGYCSLEASEESLSTEITNGDEQITVVLGAQNYQGRLVGNTALLIAQPQPDNASLSLNITWSAADRAEATLYETVWPSMGSGHDAFVRTETTWILSQSGSCQTGSDCSEGQLCFQPSPEEDRFCVETCDPQAPTCPMDQACLPTGDPTVGYCGTAEVVDLCDGIVCEGGECNPDTGLCESNGLCEGVLCGQGFACNPENGQCEDSEMDLCEGVLCGQGFVCNPDNGQCEIVGDGTAPTVVSQFPDNNGWFWPDGPVFMEFSEPIDPDSVTSESFIVRPLQPVDGVEYAQGEGLAGTFSVVDNTVTFLPERGSLYEFQTEYRVTLTSDITDLAGTPLQPPGAPLRFRTILFQSSSEYRIVFAEDNRVLAVTPPAEGEQREVTLEPPGTTGPRTVWRVEWFNNENFAFSNRASGELGFLEGGDGSAPAFVPAPVNPTELVVFTGQTWVVEVGEAREPQNPNQSPNVYRFSSIFQGPERSLGIYTGESEGLRLGVRDHTGTGETWWFERIDTPKSQCVEDPDCAPFRCFEHSRICWDFCLSINEENQCAEGARCELGICVED